MIIVSNLAEKEELRPFEKAKTVQHKFQPYKSRAGRKSQTSINTSFTKIQTSKSSHNMLSMNDSRSLTPMGRGPRRHHSKNFSSLIDAKKSHKAQPVLSRPASRSCMITYDVFGFSRPITQRTSDAMTKFGKRASQTMASRA